jgi:hypothetical protein
MKLDRAAKLAACVVLFPLALHAQAEPSPALAVCSSAYENAQEERSRGHLEAARIQLASCVQADCPEFMQADCSKWLGEIDAAMPSLVFAVRDHGEDLRDVSVTMDGKPLLNRLDGAAVIVDPGMHAFAFHLRSRSTPIVKNLLVLEGEKNRILVIELSEVLPPKVVHRAPEPEPKREPFSLPTFPEVLPYGLLGVGVLGIAGFSLFGLQGNTREAELEHTCAPNCSDSSLREVRDKWLLADISLGVGLVSLGAGTYLLLSRPAQEKRQSAEHRRLTFDVQVARSGAFSSIKTAF